MRFRFLQSNDWIALIPRLKVGIEKGQNGQTLDTFSVSPYWYFCTGLGVSD